MCPHFMYSSVACDTATPEPALLLKLPLLLTTSCMLCVGLLLQATAFGVMGVELLPNARTVPGRLLGCAQVGRQMHVMPTLSKVCCTLCSLRLTPCMHKFGWRRTPVHAPQSPPCAALPVIDLPAVDGHCLGQWTVTGDLPCCLQAVVLSA
jgi:hypothetical protein